jgi:putative peptidoglycan lipid II flippase
MINTAIKKTNDFLFKTQNTVISAAAIIAGATGLSAILGLLKGRLLTYYFGVSNDLAIFYTADRIPNMVYSVLVVGALSTIFIPVFSSMLKKDEKLAWKTASTTINGTLMFFALLGSISFVFSYQIMQSLSFGKFSPEELVLGSNLMRIMLVSQLVLIVGSFISTLLQSFKYFLIPALAPVLYNVGMIFGTIFLVGRFGIYAPAVGVLIGALLHIFVQLPWLTRVDFKYSLLMDIRDKGSSIHRSNSRICYWIGWTAIFSKQH